MGDINTGNQFLNMGLKIKDNRFSVSLQTKEMICSLPLLECLVYAAIFTFRHFSLKSEQKTLRISRSACTCNRFRAFSKALRSRAQNHDDNVVVLKRILSKYFFHHFEVFQKFIDTSIKLFFD